MPQYTLSKNERLCSKLLIDQMFGGGAKSFSVYPLRVVFMPVPPTNEAPQAAILVSVSKKRFKRAVKRNRVKRQLREAYRKNKPLLTNHLAEGNCKLAIAFIYLASHLTPSCELEEKMKLALTKITERME